MAGNLLAIVGSRRLGKSPNRGPIGPQFKACGRGRGSTVASVKKPLIYVCVLWSACAALTAAAAPATLPAAAAAASPGDEALARTASDFALQTATAAAGAQAGAKIEVQAGAIDNRLKLAPCSRVQPYLPAGQRAWGATRIGLRCVDGGAAWNISLPVTVKVLAPTLVAASALPAGTLLDSTHLRMQTVDQAAAASPAIAALPLALGRTLSRTLAAGQALHEGDLKKRQWFAIGDAVRVLAVGPGFSVSGEGVALSPGLEGQAVRVRTENGRTVNGVAVGERRVEVVL